MELIRLGFGLLMLMLLGFAVLAVKVSSVILTSMERRPVRLPVSAGVVGSRNGILGKSPGGVPLCPTPVGMRSLKTGSWIPR
jgi:hypothetical protein